MQGTHNLIVFPTASPARPEPRRPDTPDYSGRVLALNLDKVRRWQCGGFFLGPRMPADRVPAGAQMDRIHQAVREGLLLDITDDPEAQKRFIHSSWGLLEPNGRGSLSHSESDTGKRYYSGPLKLFRKAGIAAAIAEKGEDDENIAYATDDPEEQRRIAAELRVAKVVLPPGMDDPEKYLIRTETS